MLISHMHIHMYQTNFPLRCTRPVLTASSTRLSEVEHLSWTISNRYYTSTVQFLLTDSPEHLLVKISDGAPAVLLLIDSAQVGLTV